MWVWHRVDDEIAQPECEVAVSGCLADWPVFLDRHSPSSSHLVWEQKKESTPKKRRALSIYYTVHTHIWGKDKENTSKEYRLEISAEMWLNTLTLSLSATHLQPPQSYSRHLPFSHTFHIYFMCMYAHWVVEPKLSNESMIRIHTLTYCCCSTIL